MRVAVVGTGSVGKRHLANLLRLGIDVLAVSEHRRLEVVELQLTARFDLADPAVAASLLVQPSHRRAALLLLHRRAHPPPRASLDYS